MKVWFRALSKLERAIVDLTIKCVEKVRSAILAKTLSKIVEKIARALNEGFMTRAESIGSNIAKKLCILGDKWGNKTCSSWKYDMGFIRFLGVNAIYS